MTKDEMVGLHHWLNGYEFEQTLRDSDGQGSLTCCSPWDCKELDMTQTLNNNSNITELKCWSCTILYILTYISDAETSDREHMDRSTQLSSFHIMTNHCWRGLRLKLLVYPILTRGNTSAVSLPSDYPNFA